MLPRRLTACLRRGSRPAKISKNLLNFLGPCKHTTRSLRANACPVHPPVASVKADFTGDVRLCQATGKRLPAARPKSSKSNPNSLCENLWAHLLTLLSQGQVAEQWPAFVAGLTAPRGLKKLARPLHQRT